MSKDAVWLDTDAVRGLFFSKNEFTESPFFPSQRAMGEAIAAVRGGNARSMVVFISQILRGERPMPSAVWHALTAVVEDAVRDGRCTEPFLQQVRTVLSTRVSRRVISGRVGLVHLLALAECESPELDFITLLERVEDTCGFPLSKEACVEFIKSALASKGGNHA